jgi:hypothetical protein
MAEVSGNDLKIAGKIVNPEIGERIKEKRLRLLGEESSVISEKSKNRENLSHDVAVMETLRGIVNDPEVQRKLVNKSEYPGYTDRKAEDRDRITIAGPLVNNLQRNNNEFLTDRIGTHHEEWITFDPHNGEVRVGEQSGRTLIRDKNDPQYYEGEYRLANVADTRKGIVAKEMQRRERRSQPDAPLDINIRTGGRQSMSLSMDLSDKQPDQDWESRFADFPVDSRLLDGEGKSFVSSQTGLLLTQDPMWKDRFETKMTPEGIKTKVNEELDKYKLTWSEEKASRNLELRKNLKMD